jgi:hypothetical protein
LPHIKNRHRQQMFEMRSDGVGSPQSGRDIPQSIFLPGLLPGSLSQAQTVPTTIPPTTRSIATSSAANGSTSTRRAARRDGYRAAIGSDGAGEDEFHAVEIHKQGEAVYVYKRRAGSG